MPRTRLASIPLVMAIASLAAADTITVCPDGSCDFTKIGDAVAAAQAGDVIAIGAGTYTFDTPVELDDRDLIIQGPADAGKGLAVVLDGLATSSVFICRNGDETAFRNLQFTNGQGTATTFPGIGTFSIGGAVQAFDASPSFEACGFSECTAQGGGAVFAFSSGSLVFADCVFESNSSTDLGTGLAGGAVLAFGLDAPGALTLQFTDCEFLGNTADNVDSDPGDILGGAISTDRADLQLIGCRFVDNSARGLGGALGLTADDPATALLVEGCEFVGNAVDADSCFDTGLGGAVFLDDYFDAVFIDCLFDANRSPAGCSGDASAVWVQEGAPVFENCTFVNHSTGQDVFTANVSAPTFIACSFTGNTVSGRAIRFLSCTAAMVDCTISDNGSRGILNAQGGVLTLEGSTLQGNAAEAVFSGNSVDIDIVDSLICGNNGGGDQLVGGFITIDKFSIVESECPSDLPGDLDGDGAVTGADLATLAAAWGTKNPAADLDGSGDVNGADLSVLLSNWSD